MSCPPDSELCAYVDGSASPSEREHIDAHIDGCADCRRLLSELQRLEASATVAGASDPSAPLRVGDRVDRYEVHRTLGAGAMGAVYAAHDPKLKRDVALKLVFPDPAGPGNARQMREAYAMAKLRHPNVVTVHDVVIHQGCLVLAMELVDGQTLRAWLADGPDPARILEVLRQAGQGLAAAHDAGLVHRDFKPDNVIVDDTGRAHVTDFGLATAVSDEDLDGASAHGTPEGSGTRPSVTASTTYGTVVGTPAYLSPEQHRGEPASARSDQFAFCVTAYEALYGTRPFSGRTLAGLAMAVQNGLSAVPPRRAGVPRSVRHALHRGLHPDASRRFADMRALLTALTVAGSWVLPITAAAIAVAIPVAVWGLWKPDQTEAPAPRCQPRTDPLAGAWDAQRRDALGSAFRQSGHPYADDALHRVTAALDEYTRGWSAVRRDSCEATHVRGEQSEELLDLRTWCLNGRRSELAALVDRLAADPDRATVDRAVREVHGLRPLWPCSHAASLRSPTPVPTDPEQRRVLAEIDQRLAQARAHAGAGEFEPAHHNANEARSLARTLGYRPSEAEASMLLGQLELAQGRSAAAEDRLHEAISAALASDHVRVVAEASMELARIIGEGGSRFADADRWLGHAAGAIDQIGLDGMRPQLSLARAIVAHHRGDFVAAVEQHRRAVDAFGALEQGRDLGLARASNALGNTLVRQGKFDDAIPLFEQALAINEELLGPHHPDVAINLNGLGYAHYKNTDFERAEPLHRRALAIRQSALGPEHPSIGASLNNLGLALGGLGRFDDAQQAFERALAIKEKALGPDHPSIAPTVGNLALHLKMSGEYDAAFETYERALAIKRSTMGNSHPSVAHTLNAMADVREQQDRTSDAAALYAEAIAIWEPQVGAEHPGLCWAIGRRGLLLVEGGDGVTGRPMLQRAIVCLEQANFDADTLDPLRLAVGREH